jgi:hypothetical protein
MERELNENLPGNEVCHTNSRITLVTKMLCSELHSRQSLHLIIFSYKIGSVVAGESCALTGADRSLHSKDFGPGKKPANRVYILHDFAGHLARF